MCLHVCYTSLQDLLHLVFLDPEGRYYPNEGVHGSAEACGNTSCTSRPDVSGGVSDVASMFAALLRTCAGIQRAA